MGCARTGWTRARQQRQWAVTTTAAAALAVGCCGGGGTSGSGHRATVGLRSLGSGRGCREPGHGKGEAHGGGMAHDRGAGHRRAQSRGGAWREK